MLSETAQQGEILPIQQFSENASRNQLEFERALVVRQIMPASVPHYSGFRLLREPVRKHSNRLIRSMSESSVRTDRVGRMRPRHLEVQALSVSTDTTKLESSVSRQIELESDARQPLGLPAKRTHQSRIGHGTFGVSTQVRSISDGYLLHGHRELPSAFFPFNNEHARSGRSFQKKMLNFFVPHLPISSLRARNLRYPSPNLQFRSLPTPGFDEVPGVSKQSECVKTVQPGPEWNFGNHFCAIFSNSRNGYFGMIWSVLKVVLKIYFRYMLPIQ